MDSLWIMHREHDEREGLGIGTRTHRTECWIIVDMLKDKHVIYR